MMFILWSVGNVAIFNGAKDDAKYHIIDLRLVWIMIHSKKLLTNYQR